VPNIVRSVGSCGTIHQLKVVCGVKVPQHHFLDHFQMSEPGTYEVFALVKCVDELPYGNVVTELHVELEEALKQSDLYTFFGCETITEITSQEFDDLIKEHCELHAP
jgi:hypothetical protein